MNLAELAEHAAQRLGQRMVLDFEGEQFTNLQLLHWARRLHQSFSSSFKTPTMVYFVHALPKSGIGKILRRELREEAAREQKS